jgi:hypothetical protein
MSEDDVDVLALRLSASTARPLVRRQHRERRKDKRDKARAKAMAEGGDAGEWSAGGWSLALAQHMGSKR